MTPPLDLQKPSLFPAYAEIELYARQGTIPVRRSALAACPIARHLDPLRVERVGGEGRGRRATFGGLTPSRVQEARRTGDVSGAVNQACGSRSRRITYVPLENSISPKFSRQSLELLDNVAPSPTGQANRPTLPARQPRRKSRLFSVDQRDRVDLGILPMRRVTRFEEERNSSQNSEGIPFTLTLRSLPFKLFRGCSR
jgi:hypothetical protein